MVGNVLNRARVKPVCSICHSSLEYSSSDAVCASGHAFGRAPGGMLDFRSEDDRFDDWWAESDVLRQRFLDDISAGEEIHQTRLVRRLVQPLLFEEGLDGGRVLSVGCGCGSDVDELNTLGFEAWGVDCGGRSLTWGRRRSQERLLLAGAERLPFEDASFDAVLAIDLLEHIGTDGDTARLRPDGEAARQRVAVELMRVARPGAILLFSGPNRLFPLDPFHRQMKTVLGIRWHSPWEAFLLSYSDHKRLFCKGGGCDSIRTLPLDRFFSFTRVRRLPVVRAVIPAIEWGFQKLPAAFYRSPLNPFLVVVIRRARPRADGERPLC